MMKRLLFAALAGSLFLSSQALAQDDFRHLDWIGFKREGIGSPGCGITKQVIKDVWFFLYANKQGRFAIGVSSPLWNLMVGTRTPGSASFDGGKPIPLPGTLESVNTILFAGDANEFGLEERIKNSSNVRVSFDKSYLDVSLKGSATAMKLLYECAENQIEPIEHDVIEAITPSQDAIDIEGYVYIDEGKGPYGLITPLHRTDSDTIDYMFTLNSKAGRSILEKCGQNGAICRLSAAVHAEPRDGPDEWFIDTASSISLQGKIEIDDFGRPVVSSAGQAASSSVTTNTSAREGEKRSSSLMSLPIQPGYYALTDGTCAEGFGPNTIYTDGKTLSWPSSGCRFEHISQTGPSTYRVKQTCGQSDDDIETSQATYTVTDTTSFSLKSGDWETKGNYCELKTLPAADRERVSPPIYAPSNLGTQPSSPPVTEDSNAIYQDRPVVLREQEKARGAEDVARSDASSNAQAGANSNNSLEPTQYRNPADYVPKGKAIRLSSTDENAVKELIGLQLLDETSARFRNLAAAEMPDGTYVVCGFVNGKNQFGAFTGYTLFRSTYRPDAKTLTSFMMANNENLAGLCTLNGVVLQ